MAESNQLLGLKAVWARLLTETVGRTSVTVHHGAGRNSETNEKENPTRRPCPSGSGGG
jgi:hypothetical protein